MRDPIGAFDTIKDNLIRYIKTAFRTKFDSLEQEREAGPEPRPWHIDVLGASVRADDVRDPKHALKRVSDRRPSYRPPLCQQDQAADRSLGSYAPIPTRSSFVFLAATA